MAMDICARKDAILRKEVNGNMKSNPRRRNISFVSAV